MSRRRVALWVLKPCPHGGSRAPNKSLTGPWDLLLRTRVQWDIRSKHWRPVLLDPDGSHAGLDHGLHTLLPRRRGMRKNWTRRFNFHTTSTGVEDCCWVKKRLDLIIEQPLTDIFSAAWGRTGPWDFLLRTRVHWDIRSKHWRPVLLDPDGRHAGLDHGLHTLLPRRRGMRKVGGLKASFPFCLSCYVFIFLFIHLII